LTGRTLPIIVGVTGHRDLRPEDVPALTEAVRGIFEQFRGKYPSTPLVLLTALACGADQLVARVAKSIGIAYRVPMPLPEQEYRKDFQGSDATDFDELLAAADEGYFVGFVGDNDAGNVGDANRRARQYAESGAYIARISHVLIALWNGKPTDAIGGTARVVQYRLDGAPEPYRAPIGLLDAPNTGPVYQVVTPRKSDPLTDLAAGTLVLRTGSYDGTTEGALPERFNRIEQFNSDAQRFGSDHPGVRATTRFREVAAELANHYQSDFHRSLDAITVTSVVAALALIAAHSIAETYLLTLLYCVLVLVAVVCYYVASRGLWQNKFIEYRALEMGLAVQENWDLAGVKESVGNFYLRLQRSELDWIRDAIRTVYHLDPCTSFDGKGGVVAVRAFVTGQLDFFRRTARRNTRDFDRFEIAARVAFWAIAFPLTIALAATAIWHVVTGQPETRCPPIAFGSTCVSEWLINGIALATVTVAVCAEYPRRRAFHAQARRYRVMSGLYARALKVLDDAKDAPLDAQVRTSQEVIREIGREALAENGDWLMIHRELPIELLHI
jgi:hypothetical protein